MDARILKQLEETKKELNIMQDGNFTPYASNQQPEFSNIQALAQLQLEEPKLNRKQRRALAAKARRRTSEA